jgi:glycosyltransferase involved in cell wall biosynthesis
MSIPFRLFRGIRVMQPEVVLVHSFIYAWQILFLKRFLPAKTRLLVQNQAEQPFPGLKSHFQRWAAPSVDGFLFVNREQAAPWFARGIFSPDTRIFEVMEGSTKFNLRNKAECRQRLSLPAGPTFLWVGRLESNKDPLTILRAFAEFRNVCPAFRLYMAYNAECLEAEVSGFVRTNGLAENVTMLGAVEHDDLEMWYNAAEYFVLGSHHEGSGYALCEALACGCVPIVTNIPSFRKMTDAGRLGMLFEPENVRQLTTCLARTLDLQPDQLRSTARQFFENELSHAAIARKIDAACRELIPV